MKTSRYVLSILLFIVLLIHCDAIPYAVKFNKHIYRPDHQVVDDNKNYINVDDLQSKYKDSSINNILWPLPKSVSLNQSAEPMFISLCKVEYKIASSSTDRIQQIINLYLAQVFKCNYQPSSNITLTINVADPNQMIATNLTHQKYTLIIRQTNKWEILADYYVGFLRAFQTYSQLFQEKISQDKSSQYFIRNLPIIIDDQPDYMWRGLMIDTSRHYLKLQFIKKMIDGLMYNKMNVLHWHIIDQDSFPMQVPTVPELSQYGAVAGSFSQNDLKSVIQYAKSRGVRVIPQIDTPAHTDSWGRSPNLADIVINCDNQYEGQFDPTLNKTFTVVKKVMEYINQTFLDNYVHFGGDQIEEDCWDKRPQIKERMKQMNISDYDALQIYYRQQQKKIWRTINPTKKTIYWANQDIDLPLQDDDVIQWWGVSKNVDRLKGRKNQVILSNYDLTYLDIGFGNRQGDSYSVYQNWRLMYKNFTTKIQNVNVIGAQACMWSEIANQNNIETKVWIRTSVIAQKLWNSGIDISQNLNNIATRLYSQSQRLKKRGFKVSPVTVGLCQKDMSICF